MRPTTTKSIPIRLALTALVAGLLAVAGLPALAQGQGANPRLQTPKTAAVIAGDTAWVALNWLGEGEATDFSVRVENAIGSNQAAWDYPENTGDFSSLSNDATLDDGELDYTALSVSVPPDQQGGFKLNLRVRWQDERGNRSELFRIDVPVTRFEGEEFQQVTDEVQASADQETWVEVAYAGAAPRLEDFSVTVTDTDGLEVVYPGDDDASSLHHDATLSRDETDVARFLILPGGEPGTHELTLEVSATSGGERITTTTDLQVERPLSAGPVRLDNRVRR